MNLIAFCSSVHIYWSDSCPFGLGSYSNEGYAWRQEIPEDLWFRAFSNPLEYDMLAGRIQEGNVGGLADENELPRSGNADPIQAAARIKIARKQATLFLDIGMKEHSPWFKG